MKKSFIKYRVKIVSTALLLSFIYTNLSLCEFVLNNCRPDKASCCCKYSENTNTSRESIQKKCCCEIKEMASQPTENILFISDTGLKNLSSCNNHCNVFAVIFQSDKFVNSLKVLTLHSPPKKDIPILNSNFRI